MTNGKRAFIWFILCVILFVLGQVGKNSYYNGYGSVGSIRYNLLPISEEFMKIDSIIRQGNIKATYDKDRIIVTSSNKKYEYIYSKEGNNEYITNTFSKDDSDGELIAKGMIDAVYRYHGGFGTLFQTYNLFNFMSTSEKDGANLKVSDDYEIKININKNIIDSLPKSN